MGLSSEDFKDICLRTFSISDSETGEKEEKGTAVKDESGGNVDTESDRVWLGEFLFG